MADRSRIRCLALALIRHQGKLLVMEGWDPVKQNHFYRPLGGGIEFGEPGAVAVQREFKEETGFTLQGVSYAATFENIFTYRGLSCHEVVLAYHATVAEEEIYQTDRFVAHEDDGKPFEVVWISIAEALNGAKRLVPEAMIPWLAEN